MSYTPPFAGWESYDDFSREGTSITVRALRIGRRSRIELMRWAIYVRLGAVEFTAGVSYAEDS